MNEELAWVARAQQGSGEAFNRFKDFTVDFCPMNRVIGGRTGRQQGYPSHPGADMLVSFLDAPMPAGR